jgi:glutathione S-transferase
MLKLYEFALSGNCHKVRLLLSMLGLPYTSHPVNGSQAEHKSAEFLRLNPFGQVPVLLDGELALRDSQAILVYLAAKYPAAGLYPADPAMQALIQGWLSTAAHEVARGPGLLRLHYKFGRTIDLVAAQQLTTQLLNVVNDVLSEQPWLAGAQVTIADLAVYPYLALAHEGQVDLSPFPAITRWLRDFAALPGYLPMAGMVPA